MMGKQGLEFLSCARLTDRYELIAGENGQVTTLCENPGRSESTFLSVQLHIV